VANHNKLFRRYGNVPFEKKNEGNDFSTILLDVWADVDKY
jgi:hypothetical protein